MDILQPCVSFNKINTYQWYRERVFHLENHVTDLYEALKTAGLWGKKIPIGVIFRNDSAETRRHIEGKDGAAAILDLHPSTLRARMHKLGILRPETKKPN